MSALLQQVDSREMVWWAIDDKFLAEINVNRIEKCLQKALGAGALFDGLSFTDLDKSETVLGPNYGPSRKRSKIGGEVVFRKTNFRRLWLHQLIRVGVLEAFFGTLPDITFAKQMDNFTGSSLSHGQQMFVTKKTLISFFESTHRGAPTLELIRALGSKNLPTGRFEKEVSQFRQGRSVGSNEFGRIGKVSLDFRFWDSFRGPHSP
jgi:hypothetical protein